MKQHILGCVRTRGKNTTELSSWLRRKYTFLKMTDVPPGKSLVVPFVIITDGHDLMGFVNAYDVLDLGFVTIVKVDKQYWRSTKRFDAMLHNSIKINFLGLMEGTTVCLDDDVDEMSEKYFDIIDTYHAVSSRDDMQIFPIFVLKMANVTINMPEGNNDQSFHPIAIEWFKRNWDKVQITHVSKCVAQLLVRDELKIPETSEGVFKYVR